MEQSDEELMLLAAKGDQNAFATLVSRHQQGILNFFRRMGAYNNADDLAQEAFLRLYRYRDRYEPKAKLTTFLYLLARRTWIDWRRARERRKKRHEEFAQVFELEREPESPSLDEAKEQVARALETLSDEMRSVVVMSIYQGFKYREIAEIMEIPLGTVKTRMHHALRKMKKVLKNG